MHCLVPFSCRVGWRGSDEIWTRELSHGKRVVWPLRQRVPVNFKIYSKFPVFEWNWNDVFIARHNMILSLNKPVWSNEMTWNWITVAICLSMILCNITRSRLIYPINTLKLKWWNKSMYYVLWGNLILGLSAWYDFAVTGFAKNLLKYETVGW